MLRLVSRKHGVGMQARGVRVVAHPDPALNATVDATRTDEHRYDICLSHANGAESKQSKLLHVFFQSSEAMNLRCSTDRSSNGQSYSSRCFAVFLARRNLSRIRWEAVTTDSKCSQRTV